MSDNIELKPCPFCGGSAVGIEQRIEFRPSRCAAMCECCHCETGWRGDGAEAIAAWNRRVGNSAAMREALREIVALEMSGSYLPVHMAKRMAEIARAALKESEAKA